MHNNFNIGYKSNLLNHMNFSDTDSELEELMWLRGLLLHLVSDELTNTTEKTFKPRTCCIFISYISWSTKCKIDAKQFLLKSQNNVMGSKRPLRHI